MDETTRGGANKKKVKLFLAMASLGKSFALLAWSNTSRWFSESLEVKQEVKHVPRFSSQVEL